MSQQQPTQVYPVSQQYRRCNSPFTFSLFPHFSLRIFSLFFPDPLLHTQTILAFPPSFFWSPLGWCICPFWEEIGSVLANYLLACHLASPFVFSPVLLKGWSDWMVSFLFVVGWILAESVLIGCSTFLSALPLSAIHCLCTEAALRPFNRRRRISYPIHTNASTIPRLQCFIISQFLLQPPKLCIPFQLFSSPHSWTERFKSYIDCTYYISLFLHIASSLSHHHQHTIFPLSPPLYSKTDETETHCITPPPHPHLSLHTYVPPYLPLSSDHLYASL